MSHHGRHVRGLSRRVADPLKRYLWDKVFLKEDPVTHIVVLPNLQEDEGMLRETLEKFLSALPSAEKYMRIVLTMEAREGPNTSRQSRDSHGETRSTLMSQSEIQTRSTWQRRCTLRGCVGVGVIRHAYHLAQILRAQATRSQV